MLTGWRRERKIRRVLKQLAKQRVVTIVQPENVWVVEHAVSEDDADTAAALRTCHMRGWVEVLEEAVPEGRVDAEGRIQQPLRGIAPLYRLTAAGWAAIYRSHTWVVSTFIVVCATLLATLTRLAIGG